MKKYNLKLKRNEVEGIAHQIEGVILRPALYGYTDNETDKLILATLAELYNKIRSTINIYDVGDPLHKIKISVSQAMAFSIHFKSLPEASVPKQLVLTLNTVLGAIDQQSIS